MTPRDDLLTGLRRRISPRLAVRLLAGGLWLAVVPNLVRIALRAESFVPGVLAWVVAALMTVSTVVLWLRGSSLPRSWDELQR